MSAFDPKATLDLKKSSAQDTRLGGVSLSSDHMPSSREMTIGQGLLFPDQPDRGRIATYRPGLGPDL